MFNVNLGLTFSTISTNYGALALKYPEAVALNGILEGSNKQQMLAGNLPWFALKSASLFWVWRHIHISGGSMLSGHEAHILEKSPCDWKMYCISSGTT